MTALVDTDAVPVHTAGRTRDRRTRTLVLVESLLEQIVSLMAVGDRLPTEAELVDQHAVSRTVVRSALAMLQAYGVLESRQGVGSFVLSVSGRQKIGVSLAETRLTGEVMSALELRIGLEIEAAGLAAQRRSEGNLQSIRLALDRFNAALDMGSDLVLLDAGIHVEIARASQKAHFEEIIGNLGVAVIQRGPLYRVQPPEVGFAEEMKGVSEEHELIFEAIVAQDIEAAKAAMRLHPIASYLRHRSDLAS